MVASIYHAPGRPGIPPRWTSSVKTGVGTALNPSSRLWFTISHGILNEIYYPRVDQACIRDLGLIVTDGREFFSEEKRHTRHQVGYPGDGAPAYSLINTCEQGRYQIEKKIVTDPQRVVLLQHTRCVPLLGALGDYHLYVLLSPHLGNRGYGNTAWVDEYKGVPMLFGERQNIALALACSISWLKRSVGFVGISDGWQDLREHKQMAWIYQRAEDGNVALTGEVNLQDAAAGFVLALGFGRNSAEAGQRTLASLLAGFEAAHKEYVMEWQAWQNTLSTKEITGKNERKLFRVSAAVLRTHEEKRFPGGIIASLSIPWGFSKGDENLGGYHLVWPRDLVEVAGGLLAAGANEDVRRVVYYLQSTQEADGHWPQNMWMDGTPYWTGVQMDETAFPILLVDLARRKGALDAEDIMRLWPMVRRAARFLTQNGPVTQEDRWEEDPGYSPFTLAVETAALLAAADIADLNESPGAALYLRETADAWNASIERWTYVTGTELARQVGVDGFYVRIAPPEVAEEALPTQRFVPIRNLVPGQRTAPADHIVSPDALSLVRFGLRSPDDPRVVNTVKVIDALLKVETSYGPAWHRYNGDPYGEHEDGTPFDGSGVGRVWPLLTGERAHYELAAGHRERAEKLLQTLEAFANEGGMIPEQIWDSPDIPERNLFFGRPSGSAMPLVWAHAEYVKLCRSLYEGRVFDMPPQPVERYLINKAGSGRAIWSFNLKIRRIQRGKTLRLEASTPAVIHWSIDNWQRVQSTKMRSNSLGGYVADLPTENMPQGETIFFTFYWLEADRWENMNFSVVVESPG